MPAANWKHVISAGKSWSQPDSDVITEISKAAQNANGAKTANIFIQNIFTGLRTSRVSRLIKRLQSGSILAAADNNILDDLGEGACGRPGTFAITIDHLQRCPVSLAFSQGYGFQVVAFDVAANDVARQPTKSKAVADRGYSSVNTANAPLVARLQPAEILLAEITGVPDYYLQVLF